MPNITDLSSHHRLLRLATHASVATAVILITGKLVAWLMTGSVSVLASLIDSMMDAAASLINLFAVRYALMPPDPEHRFGHGKAESLAGLAQTTFIAGSALFFCRPRIGCCIPGRWKTWASGWGSWHSRYWRPWRCWFCSAT